MITVKELKKKLYYSCKCDLDKGNLIKYVSKGLRVDDKGRKQKFEEVGIRCDKCEEWETLENLQKQIIEINNEKSKKETVKV